MNISIPEEQFARLRRNYLDELKLEEKLVLIVNDTNIDKTKIRSYIFQIDSCKDQRIDIAKEMKKLVTTFPRLARSLDFLRDIMLKEEDKPDEIVELNPQYIIRRIFEIVPRLYSNQADILDRENPSKLNKKDWHVINNHFKFDKIDIPEYIKQRKAKDKEDNINNFRIEKEREEEEDDVIPQYIFNDVGEVGDRAQHLKEIKMINDLSQGGVYDINDPTNLRLDNDLVKKYLKENELPLDNSKKLKLYQDSVKEIIARLRSSYYEVRIG
jgi:hypothetical protein